MQWQLILDLTIVVLLVAFIVHALMLYRQLKDLRKNREDMIKVIATFNEATTRAESGIPRLRKTAEDANKSLDEQVSKARTLRDDLAYMVDRADGMATRLEAVVRQARGEGAGAGGAAGTAASGGVGPGSPNMVTIPPAGGAGSLDTLEAERGPSAQRTAQPVRQSPVRAAQQAMPAGSVGAGPLTGPLGGVLAAQSVPSHAGGDQQGQADPERRTLGRTRRSGSLRDDAMAGGDPGMVQRPAQAGHPSAPAGVGLGQGAPSADGPDVYSQARVPYAPDAGRRRARATAASEAEDPTVTFGKELDAIRAQTESAGFDPGPSNRGYAPGPGSGRPRSMPPPEEEEFLDGVEDERSEAERELLRALRNAQ